MFRRFTAITFALIFTLVTGSALGQVPKGAILLLFCQEDPDTGATAVCAMESSDPNPPQIGLGTPCVDALAFLTSQGFVSFPAMAIAGQREGLFEPYPLACLGESDDPLFTSQQKKSVPLLVFPLGCNLEVCD